MRLLDESKNASRSLLVYFLVIAFGSSAWIAINGLWVQTPLLVNRLPEAWDLSSWIVVLTQIANIGPIAYGVLGSRFHISETWSIHAIMSIGFISCILMASVWDKLVVIAGKERSLAFLIVTGVLALVDCTSSVLYFPFLSNFEPQYLQALLLGEGLSGLIPSFVALAQGVGGNPQCVNVSLDDGTYQIKAIRPSPRFSIEVFFYFLAGLALVSWTSFFILTKLRRGKVTHLQESQEADTLPLDSPSISNRQLLVLLLIQGFCCLLMNGVLSALQTYATLPYGNVTHHLATTLSVIAGPVAVFLTFVLQDEKTYLKPILPLLTVGTLCAGYIMFLATQSPSPPLQDSVVGSVIVVIAYIIYHGFYSYVKSCIAGRLRYSSFEGRRALLFYGIATQIGSLIGAFGIFIVMHSTHVFKSYNPCR